MALKNTIKKMEALLAQLTLDLVKAEKGNKAAAQRVRTLSIQFAKVSKVYRKESIQGSRTTRKKKKTTTRKKATTRKPKAKKSVKRKKVARTKKKKTTRRRR